MARKREPIRGLWEREPGSDIWWIRYRVDGVLKREKVLARTRSGFRPRPRNVPGDRTRVEGARSSARRKDGRADLTDLTKWMDREGSLATLRHGFKCYGKTLRVAFFKAAHALNPELDARYAANRAGITRQLYFSKSSEKSLDVALRSSGSPAEFSSRDMFILLSRQRVMTLLPLFDHA
jgi:hypothetical protein